MPTAIEEGLAVYGELVAALDAHELSDEDCATLDRFEEALASTRELVGRLYETLKASHVGLYPESYPPAVQVQYEVVQDEGSAYNDPEDPRQWDSSTIEWAADDITKALGYAEQIKTSLEKS